jgi:hypothetical protein
MVKPVAWTESAPIDLENVIPLSLAILLRMQNHFMMQLKVKYKV